MKSDLDIVIDTRERKPLPLPGLLVTLNPAYLPAKKVSTTLRVRTFRETLATGDYAVRGCEKHCLIEHKGAVCELARNCLSPDRARFLRALDRLSLACTWPILLCEGDLSCTEPDDPLAIDAFLRVLMERRITLHLMPGATALARRIARGMGGPDTPGWHTSAGGHRPCPPGEGGGVRRVIALAQFTALGTL